MYLDAVNTVDSYFSHIQTKSKSTQSSSKSAIDDGQGIATYYSSWLENKETNTPQHGHINPIC